MIGGSSAFLSVNGKAIGTANKTISFTADSNGIDQLFDASYDPHKIFTKAASGGPLTVSWDMAKMSTGLGLGSTSGMVFANTTPNSAHLTADLTVTYSYTAVPEPSTWVMMVAGFAGLGFAGWRASRKAAAVAA